MGVISATDNKQFISAKFLYSKIKRRLKSFVSVNLVDELNFAEYTMDILRTLGSSSAKELEVMLKIKDSVAKLPENYKQYHAFYKANDYDDDYSSCNTDKRIFQGKTIFEEDVTCEFLNRDKNCVVDCCDDKLISRVTVRRYIKDQPINCNYTNLVPMLVTPNVRPSNGQTILSGNRGCMEITIDEGYVICPFEEGFVFMQYYGYPFDEEGLPMIEDNKYVEAVIENYIIWQTLLDMYLGDEVANVIQKAQLYQMMYNEALAELRFHKKLPTFGTLVNYVRNKRAINPVNFFSQTNRRR